MLIYYKQLHISRCVEENETDTSYTVGYLYKNNV
jgi:hypothetical protein